MSCCCLVKPKIVVEKPQSQRLIRSSSFDLTSPEDVLSASSHLGILKRHQYNAHQVYQSSRFDEKMLSGN